MVHDEPDFLESISGVLRAYVDASAVATAGSAVEALHLVKAERPFDLVITEYDMPRMDGVDFLKVLHQIRPGTPSVLLSADPDGAADALARSPLTRVTQIEKPIGPDELIQVVTRLTDGRALEARA